MVASVSMANLEMGGRLGHRAHRRLCLRLSALGLRRRDDLVAEAMSSALGNWKRKADAAALGEAVKIRASA
jgi:hypothetical protein